MFFLFILFFQNVFNEECHKCVTSKGNKYDCGSSIFNNKTSEICCNKNWCKCFEFTDGWSCRSACLRCKLSLFYQIIDESVITNSYFFTKNKKLCTEYVFVAAFNIQTNKYLIDKIVHSSQVKKSDLIFWPASEFNSNFPVGQSVITFITHYNISNDNYKCCLSFNNKLCCGNGCYC